MSRGSKLFSGLLRLKQIVVVETVVVGHSAAVHIEPPLQLSCNEKEAPKLESAKLVTDRTDSIFLKRASLLTLISKRYFFMGHPVKLGILHLSARIRPIPKLQSKDLGRQTKCSPVTDKVLLVIESSNRAESGEAGAIVAMSAVVVYLSIS